MKFVHCLNLTAIACLALAGCHREVAAEKPDHEAKVAGDRIIFPDQSPALQGIKAAAAQPSGTASVRLNGRLVWNDDLTVRVFAPFAGRVEKILVDNSQVVAAGETLGLLASPDYSQMQADAAKARADAALAAHTLDRVRSLLEHGAVAEKEVQAAEADFARTRSEQERAEASLQLRGGAAAAGNPFYPLKTQIGGVVVERNINPGQEVRPDQILANAPQFFAPLFVVTDPAHLWVVIDATEHDLAVMRPGTPFTAQSPALPGEMLHGKVDWVADSLDPATRMVKVRGRVENPDRRFKAEMLVALEFEDRGQPGVDAPAAAVFMKGDREFVFVEERPGSYVRREVQIGPQHAQTILVTQGVQAGEQVVTEGGLLLDAILADAAGG